MFPEYKEKGLKSLPQLVLFTSEHVSLPLEPVLPAVVQMEPSPRDASCREGALVTHVTK